MGSRTKPAAVIQRFQRWVKEHVSQPSDETNDIPACPFAAGALKSGSVLCHLSPTLEMIDFIKASAPTDGLSHIVFIPSTIIDPNEFAIWIGDQNENTFGWWTMGYHPQAEEHAPVWQAYDEDDHALVLVQNLEELVTASGQLAAKGYYKNSEPWQIEDIIDRQEKHSDWIEIETRLVQQDEEEIH